MPTFGEKLRGAREAAALSVDAMARLIGVEPTMVDALERDAELPRAAILREYATVFGSRLERFLAAGATASPAALLFRSAAEHGTDLSRELGVADLRTLGDFLALVTDMDALERMLDHPRAELLTLETPDHDLPDWLQGQHCAARVRGLLGLGDEPIPSMITLLEDQLRWSLFFVTPDELSVVVQGASTAKPKPAILVNLVGGRESWWRTRVNLAHEMCHILLDSRTQPYLLSPEGGLEERGQWSLIEHFRSVERRANAFAVHFLAPASAVRVVVGSTSPESDAAIEGICTTFGVGRTVAVRRLGHEYGLSEQVQTRMLTRGGRVQHRQDHADAAIVAGLRGARLERLVLEALHREQIDAIEARSLLGISMAAPLPGGGARSLPLVRAETLARARAEAHEWALHRSPCVSTEATRTDDGWNVVVECNEGDGSIRRTIRLSPAFEPLDRI